ncbi:MAG: Uma2 family endonuclease [Gammaproteobacteria bacterium]
MGLALRDDKKHSYGEYLSWPEDVRYELINGDAYLMVPAPSSAHQLMVGALFGQLRDHLRGTSCIPVLAPFDVRLPKSNEADEDIDTVVQPDISVICDKSKIDEQGCRGAPDWIIEILSPSSAGHDQTRKLTLYESAGVREYWLIHPTDRVLTVYTLHADSYTRPDIQELTGSTTSQAVSAVTIDWDALVREVDK